MDALVSMAVYTVVTAVFYLLGAAVLHRLGEFPDDCDLLHRLSLICTESLGAWVKWLYLAGAIAATGAWFSQVADAAGQFGFIDFIWFRRKQQPPSLKPGLGYDIALTLSIVAVGIQALASAIAKVTGASPSAYVPPPRNHLIHSPPKGKKKSIRMGMTPR